jgi:hypothetical protein
MKVSHVSLGQHVLSNTTFRTGERYIGLGVVLSMFLDKVVLMVDIQKDDKSVFKIGIPIANIAYMTIVEDTKK